MTSETGAVTAQYVYTPYGVESPYNASGNPYRYTGRRLDAQWGVYYYRARYYDPQLGRFLETDPAGYADSMNLYAYVGHDPLNLTDPSGEFIDPGDRFPTIDEAAVDLLEYAAQETVANDGFRARERGGDIKVDQESGEFYYNNIDVGTNDGIDVGIGETTVAIAHTHPPSEGAGPGLQNGKNDRANDGAISRQDRTMVGDANRNLGREIHKNWDRHK